MGGLIVEFFVTKGSTNQVLAGKATDENGVATFETYLLTNDTAQITALVSGSLSPTLVFTVHGEGVPPPGLGEETPFYSPWKAENTNFFLGIPTYIIMTGFGVILLIAI